MCDIFFIVDMLLTAFSTLFKSIKSEVLRNRRSVSCHLLAVEANFSWPFNSINIRLPLNVLTFKVFCK
jgi:hypothetical protein